MHHGEGVGGTQGLGGDGLVRQGRVGRGRGAVRPCVEERVLGRGQEIELGQGTTGLRRGGPQQYREPLGETLDRGAVEQVGGELRVAAEAPASGIRCRKTSYLAVPACTYIRSAATPGRSRAGAGASSRPKTTWNKGKRPGERSTFRSRISLGVGGVAVRHGTPDLRLGPSHQVGEGVLR